MHLMRGRPNRGGARTPDRASERRPACRPGCRRPGSLIVGPIRGPTRRRDLLWPVCSPPMENGPNAISFPGRRLHLRAANRRRSLRRLNFIRCHERRRSAVQETGLGSTARGVFGCWCWSRSHPRALLLPVRQADAAEPARAAPLITRNRRGHLTRFAASLESVCSPPRKSPQDGGPRGTKIMAQLGVPGEAFPRRGLTPHNTRKDEHVDSDHRSRKYR